MNKRPAVFAVDTGDIPADQRVGYFREELSETIGRFDIEVLTETPMRQVFTLTGLPTFDVLTMSTSAVRSVGHNDLGGEEEVAFNIMAAGPAPALHHQLGRVAELHPGEGALMALYERTVYESTGTCRVDAVRLSRRELATRVPDLDDTLAALIPADRPALALLSHYLNIVRATPLGDQDELSDKVASHIYDLVALALKPTPKVLDNARGGAQAARRVAIRHYVSQNLGDPSLSTQTVAARFGISDRYLRVLFEEGGGFWSFVMARRLELASRMLSNPQMAEVKIIDIAYRCGFNSLSTFNRAFVRAYGCRPSSLR